MEEQATDSTIPNQPSMPSFEDMRRMAMQKAIQDITGQPPAQQQPGAPAMNPFAGQPQPQPQPQPQVAPTGMNASQYIPQQYPANIPQFQYAPPSQVPEEEPEDNPVPVPLRIVRRNLTKFEIAAVFVAACITVSAVQATWNFATDILPRIEIRSN